VGLVNLILLLVALKIFVNKEEFSKLKIETFVKNIKTQYVYVLIILGVVAFHLLEVNVIDSNVTKLVGHDYADTVHIFENNIVYWFSQHWTPFLVYFFVTMYIAVYPFVLWFAPLYYLLFDKKESMKKLAYGLLLVYIITLPFYLFIPVTNVYTYYNIGSPLENVIPSVEQFFYSTTTYNNCLPSLHTAVIILVTWSTYYTKNKKLLYFTMFCMVTVITSVLYLAIHWVTDVITGVTIATGVILLLKKNL